MVSSMYASEARERSAERTSEKTSRPTWAEHVGEEAYALAIYRLQNEADLSFKEARATLLPVQLIKPLAEEWGCSVENVYNLRRKGMDKVRELTGGNDKEFARFLPSELSHIF